MIPYVPFAGIPAGNFYEAPRYCEVESENPADYYSLRIDSPAAPEHSGTCGLIGVYPVECAWDDLVRSSNVGAGDDILIPQDLVVPSGKTLTMNEGATLRADGYDDSNRGNDLYKNEITVHGTLDVNGSPGNPVRFVSAVEPQSEGDWYGIHVKGGSVAQIDGADIQHAVYGTVFQTEDATSHIKFSAFSNNQNRDILAGAGGLSFPVSFEENAITIGGGIGIELQSVVSGATLSKNVLTGDGASSSGIELGLFTTDQQPVIAENTISLDFHTRQCANVTPS